jgi:hypothetical protein
VLVEIEVMNHRVVNLRPVYKTPNTKLSPQTNQVQSQNIVMKVQVLKQTLKEQMKVVKQRVVNLRPVYKASQTNQVQSQNIVMEIHILMN